MKKYFGTILVLITAISLWSCEKDTSATSYTPAPTVPLAKGSLQDNLGNCSTITIHGSFLSGIALTPTNYITATVNFTEVGKYKIYTNTVNGCWFSMDTTIATTIGTQTITLKGYGTPILADTASFTLTFLNTNCAFSLVTAAGPHISSETDYFPMTTGSYITYNTDTVANRYANDTLRFSFNGSTQTINGITYKLAISNKHDTSFYRKDGLGHYYEYAKKLASVIPPVEYMLLDDTKSVGQSWQTDTLYTKYNLLGTITNIKVVLKCTIIAKNVAFNFITPSLDSTIQVKEELLVYDYQGNDFSFALLPTEVYYTKKIGMVEFDAPTYNTYLRIKDWYIQ